MGKQTWKSIIQAKNSQILIHCSLPFIFRVVITLPFIHNYTQKRSIALALFSHKNFCYRGISSTFMAKRLYDITWNFSWWTFRIQRSKFFYQPRLWTMIQISQLRSYRIAEPNKKLMKNISRLKIFTWKYNSICFLLHYVHKLGHLKLEKFFFWWGERFPASISYSFGIERI